MSSIAFKIENSSGLPDDKVFIGFWTSQLNGEINGKAILPIYDGVYVKGNWYKLSEITSCQLDKTTSGRVYVCYNEPFAPTSGGGIPSIVAPNSDAYNKRFDKFELTFDGSPYGVADLTSIDYWSIPMSLEVSKKKVLVGALDGICSGKSMSDIFNGLSTLSSPVQSSKTAKNIEKAFKAAGHALPFILDANSGVVTTSNASFVRIIGPNSYPAFGNPSKSQFPGLPFTPYNTFEDYFRYLIANFGVGKTVPTGFTSLGNGKIAVIKGDFSGSKGTSNEDKAQTYDLSAEIDNDMNLTLKGKGSIVGNISIKVSKWDLLNPTSTYGGNPTITLNGTPNVILSNNIYARILGDFFAGLNIGTIGSTEKFNEILVGEMSSSQWFSKLPPKGYLFDKLWPSTITNHWNQWAATFNNLSDAYNFAYAERFSSPQLTLNPKVVDTLTLKLLMP